MNLTTYEATVFLDGEASDTFQFRFNPLIPGMPELFFRAHPKDEWIEIDPQVYSIDQDWWEWFYFHPREASLQNLAEVIWKIKLQPSYSVEVKEVANDERV